MANTLKLKRSAVQNKVPLTTDLDLGELAINTYDGKLYLKKDNGTQSIVEVGGNASAGVASFNTRTGAVTLTSADVTTALTYTPVNKAGDTMTGKLTLPGVTTSGAPLCLSNPSTGDVPSSPANGDVWINNNGFQFRQGTVTQTVATLGGTQTFTGATTFQGTLNATSNVNLGNNTGASTHNLAHGATTSGNTKAVNIGTGGLSGSTTTITIGSSAGTSTTTVNGSLTASSLSGSTLTSTVATGTAPLTVTSTTAVTNLNADLLDGNHAAAFALAGHSHDAAYASLTHNHDATYQAKDADLTAIAALAGTSGFLKKTAADTWTLDTSTYLTGNQSITLSGDASGSGATAITVTLATVNSNVGTFNNVTVNAKGLVTGASNVSYVRSDASTSMTQGVGIRFGHTNQTDTNDGFIGAALFASGLNIVGTQTTAGTGRQVRIWGSLIDNGGNVFLNSSNYNSYAPTLTGGNASGTWSINVTGSAGSASSATTAQRMTDFPYTTDWATTFNNTPAMQRTWLQASTGGPTGTWWFMENMRHSNGTNYWGTQLAWGWEDNANQLYQRNVSGGTWSGWVKYLNTGNIGGTTVSSTSVVTNLNADLLDGYHATTANTASTVAVRDANGNLTVNDWFASNRGVINTSLVSTDQQFGVFFENNGSTAYAIYREGGSWVHPYPDLRIAFHTGIKIGANAGYGGIKFYTDYDMATKIFTINESDANVRVLGGAALYISQPGASWDSKAALIVGSGGDAYLMTRHIRGKTAGADNADTLYLNYASNGGVYVGGALSTTGNIVCGSSLQMNFGQIYPYNAGGSWIDGDGAGGRLAGNYWVVNPTLYTLGRIQARGGISNDTDDLYFYGAGGSANRFIYQSGAPEIHLYATSGSANQRRFRIVGVNGNMVFDGVNDAVSDYYTRGFAMGGNTVYPVVDNAMNLGLSGQRWIAVYAVNGTIQTSDVNKKTDIQPAKLGLEFVNKLKPVSYRWKDGDQRERYGVVAQDVRKVVEELGIEFGDLTEDCTGLNYSGLVGPLIKAVQELSSQIREIKEKAHA